MTSRKLLFAGAAAALALAGCADYPYNDPNYAAYPGYAPGYAGPYYSDSYYAGPTVGLGITYSNRDGYWDRDHHWRRYHRDRDHDHD